MWLITLGFGFGKTRAVRCYITLLLWIILVSFAFYWFLTHYNISSDNNFIWTFEQYRVDQEKSGKGQSYSAYNAVFHRQKTAEDKLHDGLKSPRDVGPENHEGFDFLDDYGSLKSVADEAEAHGLSSSIKRLCNHPNDIKAGEENLRTPEFQLDALIMVFRHGDRGPLSHVGSRNLSHIDCSTNDPDFLKFQKFMTDTVSRVGGYAQFIGPFQSFQKAPTNGNCQLGQLSQLGSLQLIRVGRAIKAAYSDVFSKILGYSTLLNLKSALNPPLGNNVTVASLKEVGLIHPFQNTRVIAYSTRYRRTLQSLMAFLYGLLGPRFLVSNAIVRESQSISFCFNDCSCRATEKLKKGAGKLYRPKSTDKSSMITLVERMNSIIGSEKSRKTGTTLLDLLMVYPCHNAELPCKEKAALNAIRFHDCITQAQVSSLIELLQKENHNQKKILSYKQYHILTSYGLLKEIVNLSLKMTSAGNADSRRFGKLHSRDRLENNILTNNIYSRAKTRIGLFSGHDTTLQSLAGALGIHAGHPDIHLVPYASRLVFEFYRKTNISPESPRKHYFRVIFNGRVVTHLVKFCKMSDKIIFADPSLVSRNNPSSPEYQTPKPASSGTFMLCPLENLVRFVHDRYFESFGNVTNFKEACEKTGKKRKK